MEELDDAARHVLNVVAMIWDCFNDPYSHLGPKESDPVDTNAESRLAPQEAREVARKPGVAENRPETLPLKKICNHCGGWVSLADSKRDVMRCWSGSRCRRSICYCANRD